MRSVFLALLDRKVEDHAGAEDRPHEGIGGALIDEQLAAQLASERERVVASFARRDSTGEIPRRCALILSPPRTGSTWLFDALRCHPAIGFDSSAALVEALGVDAANRYPAGLANDPQATADVEIRPWVGARVPAFVPPPQLRASFAALGVQRVAIEKLHPQFFDWDATAFAARVAELEARHGIAFEFIYRVRDPRDTLVSILRYRQRDPTWLRHVPLADVPEYLRRSFAVLADFSEVRPGIIVDYASSSVDPAGALFRVYESLWPAVGAELHREVARWARDATSRDLRRRRSPGPFLGAQTSEVAELDDEVGGIVEQHATTLAACRVQIDRLAEIPPTPALVTQLDAVKRSPTG